MLRGVDRNEGVSNDFPRATILGDDLAGCFMGGRGKNEKFTTYSFVVRERECLPK